MEGRKQVRSSSSSFTSDLFGSRENISSSTGIFGSIFADSTSSKILGRESLRCEGTGEKQSFTEAWKPKSGAPDDTTNGKQGESHGRANRELSSIYPDQRVQPCHLSSSIYYGGQDVYSHPQSAQSPGFNSMLKKDGGEDDTGSASRGNWWKGSLYY